MTLRISLVFILALLLIGCSSDPVADLQDGDDPIVMTVNGNEEVSDNELLNAARAELKSFFKNGRRPADLDDASHAMRQHLLGLGFVDASTRFTGAGEDGPKKKVAFEIEEGQRFYLGQVRFTGNAAVGDEELKPYFDFPGSSILGMGETLFRVDRLRSAARAVESLYLGRGYMKVRVLVENQKRRPEDSKIDVVVEIEEGPQYFIDTVEIRLAGDAVDAEIFEKARRAAERKPFSPKVVSGVENAIRRELADRAHLRAKLKRVLEIDEELKTAQVRFEVEPGPRLKLGKIVVGGQERTDLDFILERLALEEGDLLTQKKIDAGLNRLYGTGLFDRVKLTPTADADPEPEWLTSDIDVELSEIPARSVDFEVGYGSYELLRGRTRYRDRNVFGMGREFEGGLSASFKHFGADLRFLDPYTLGGPNTLQFNLAVQRRDFRSHVSNSVDARLSVKHTFSSRMEVESGYRLRLADASDAAIDDDDQEEFLTSALFARFVYDGRDDVLLPTNGLFFSFAVDWSTSLLGSDRDFVGLNAELSYLFEITEGTVLAVGLSAGTRYLLDDGPTLPIQERYFLGGESSVRSFQEGDLGPIDAFGDPIGGLSSVQAHVELRQRIIGDFQIALFYDVGAVDRDSFALGELGHAVGIGLRYLLPFGPARLDFGYNPGERFASDDDWALHFAFGFSF